jgi:hypothetical protein
MTSQKKGETISGRRWITCKRDDVCGGQGSACAQICLRRPALAQCAPIARAPLVMFFFNLSNSLRGKLHHARDALRPSACCQFTPSSIDEGAGKAGCRPHPWSACNKNARGRTTGTSRTSGLPCATVLRLIRALPGAPGFLATMTRMMLTHQHEDTSVGVSGPHDFAVRDCVARRHLRATPHPRPSHCRSNVRDDAYAPHPDRNARSITLIL